MTPEELAPVWEAYWSGPRPLTYERYLYVEAAHEVLVRQFLPLANYHARQALAKAPVHQNAEDIHSYAHHGLLDAISKFRPDAGAKFETYATRRIRGQIMDGQRKDDPLTRSSRGRVKLMVRAIEALWIGLGREPTEQEIATQTQALATRPSEVLSVDEVRLAVLEQQSMTAELDESDSAGPMESEAELNAQISEVSALVAQRLARMPGRERAFTLLFYCDERTMTEAGDELELGSDWCSRTKNNVLIAIRG